MIVPAVSLRPVSDIPLVFILENFIISFQSRNDMGSQETTDARNIRESFLLFCCLKAGRHIRIQQHSQERKEGGERLQKVGWLDQDCNKCGRQLNSWDARLSKTLAYKYTCCESCIAGEYDMSAERLRDRMENYFGMRPCQGL